MQNPTLLAASLATVVASSVPAIAQTPAAADRPNIIFIITDDQRFDALSCVQKEQGNAALYPWLKTPNMDRIANEGARFRNAFVVHSLCSPSRATFLTGLYSHQHTVVDNARSMPLNLPTWSAMLHDSGYSTGYFGKYHMFKQKERPGFSSIFSYIGQGSYQNCTFQADGNPVATQGWIDDVTTDHAIEFIEQHKSEPFAMVIGYKAPHSPRNPPARRAEDLADVTFTKPVNADVEFPFGSITPQYGYPFKPENPDVKNYFRCILAIDDCVGKVLDTLDTNKLADNTMVVFVGDNGYYLGEHRLSDKRSAYEESMRIPLLVRYPRKIKAGTIIDAMALNTDLAPTILDCAGLKKTAQMSGLSWMPLFADKSAPWRTGFVYENYLDEMFPKVTLDLLAYRTADYKLIKYVDHPEWTELFDLKSDPYEMRNLMGDPRYTAKASELATAMDESLRQTGYYASPATQRARRLETAEGGQRAK